MANKSDYGVIGRHIGFKGFGFASENRSFEIENTALRAENPEQQE
ncbi:MAG: hypothetical protein ACK4NS_09995 [Saprospiraceae bacterium]